MVVSSRRKEGKKRVRKVGWGGVGGVESENKSLACITFSHIYFRLTGRESKAVSAANFNSFAAHSRASRGENEKPCGDKTCEWTPIFFFFCPLAVLSFVLHRRNYLRSFIDMAHNTFIDGSKI